MPLTTLWSEEEITKFVRLERKAGEREREAGVRERGVCRYIWTGFCYVGFLFYMFI